MKVCNPEYHFYPFWCLSLKRCIQVKGFQVAPAELEGCILSHTDVDNVCVVGVPHEYSASLSFSLINNIPKTFTYTRWRGSNGVCCAYQRCGRQS